jgi:hypothetical protein
MGGKGELVPQPTASIPFTLLKIGGYLLLSTRLHPVFWQFDE